MLSENKNEKSEEVPEQIMGKPILKRTYSKYVKKKTQHLRILGCSFL